MLVLSKQSCSLECMSVTEPWGSEEGLPDSGGELAQRRCGTYTKDDASGVGKSGTVQMFCQLFGEEGTPCRGGKGKASSRGSNTHFQNHLQSAHQNSGGRHGGVLNVGNAALCRDCAPGL